MEILSFPELTSPGPYLSKPLTDGETDHVKSDGHLETNQGNDAEIVDFP